MLSGLFDKIKIRRPKAYIKGNTELRVKMLSFPSVEFLI